EARDEHADGTVRARGLHGTGHRAGRDGGPVPRDGRPEVPTVAPPEEVRPRGARRPEVRPRGVRLHARMNLREAGPSGAPAAETSRAVGPRVADASGASRRPRRPRPR